MIKPQKAVIDNTKYIAAASLVLSVLMQSVFLVVGKWDLSVLFGNVLGLLAAVGNFFVMGLFIQHAVSKDEKQARDIVKLSQTLRMFGLLIFAVIGICVPIFNGIATVIPYLFPRIAIAIYPLIIKKGGNSGEN